MRASDLDRLSREVSGREDAAAVEGWCLPLVDLREPVIHPGAADLLAELVPPIAPRGAITELLRRHVLETPDGESNRGGALAVHAATPGAGYPGGGDAVGLLAVADRPGARLSTLHAWRLGAGRRRGGTRRPGGPRSRSLARRASPRGTNPARGNGGPDRGFCADGKISGLIDALVALARHEDYSAPSCPYGDPGKP